MRRTDAGSSSGTSTPPKGARTPRVLAPDGKMMFGTWPGPQDKFWDYRGRYGLIAGSGFTGKTELLRWYPAQQIAEDEARIKAGEITESLGHALYLRREMPLLRETMARCARDFPRTWPGVEWKAKESAYVWPCGYRMTLGHMQFEDDWKKYASWQITLCLWDELPTFVQEQWDMLDNWVRQPAGSLLTPMHRAGGNPIGVGRAWVKKFFVDVGPQGKEVVKATKVEVEDEDGAKRIETVTRGRIYIFAKVSDNKSVDQAAYIASFEGKNASVTAAMRDGDWDAAVGDLIGQAWDRGAHVVKPFVIPSGWRKGRSTHFGYAVTTTIWWAMDFDGNFTVYRDLRLTNHTAEMAADRIRELEEEAKEWWIDEGFRGDEDRGSKIVGVLGPASAWGSEKNGLSASRTMRRLGIPDRPASEDLKSAVDEIRMRLLRRTIPKGAPKKDPGVPALRYFPTCTASLETVPSMSAAKDEPDLPEPKTDASAYKALCYAVLSRPMKPEKSKPADSDWDTAPKPKTARKSKSGYPGMF